MDAVVSKGLTAICLFADVAAAFAEARRVLIIPVQGGEAELVDAAVAAGMERALAVETVAELVRQDFWPQCGASSHLAAMVSETLSGSFATFERVDGATQMHNGTGAGNPVADLLFALAFAKMVQKLRARLEGAGLVASVCAVGASLSFGWEKLLWP